jgi:hydroxymethylglutaryl-CoA lyase
MLADVGAVRIVEVGPRDGLQNEQSPVPTHLKRHLIERLVAAGVSEAELTSFVRPDRIPQLADAEELLQELRIRPNRSIVLAPNLRAIERAAGLGVTEVAVFAAASEAFSQANLGCSIERSIEMFTSVATAARERGWMVRGYVSTVLGCPFQGPVRPEEVASVLDAMLGMGCHEVSLGDTVGVGTYGEVQHLIGFLGERFPLDRLAVHMHDTYGQGLANTLAAIEAGIRIADTSVGGLGGCPYAGGRARGNLATEDLVYALERSGVRTGIDLDALVDTAVWISDVLGRPPASRVASAYTSARQAEATAP